MPETPVKEAPETASPKSSPSKKEIDAATMALNHFAQGKRHLVVGDIPSAVNSLQEACKLLADQYGETAPECGDAYFAYGKALLEMARLESGVIGNALEGVPDGEDADNSQVSNPDKLSESQVVEVTEMVEQALEENFEGLEKKSVKEKTVDTSKLNGHSNGETNGKKCVLNEEVVNNEKGQDQEVVSDEIKASEQETSANEKGENDKKEGSTENEDSDGDAESQEGESQDGESQEGEEEGEEGDKEEEEGEKEGEGEKTEDDDDEVSNLQLSWEMLELAKMIFEKQSETNPKVKTKVAEVFLKLGEVGLESENYSQGIDDFKQCLQIQKSVLESDDRCLAETHYQLGISYSFCDEFDLAIESFKSAVNVLETRITNLQKIQKEKADWTEEQKMKDAATKADPFYTEQGEIDELNQLLPEMKEKILDMEQVKKDSMEKIKAAKEAMMSSLVGGESSQAGSSSQSPFGVPSSSSSTKEAKPIMVVRKKRKLEDGGDEDSKKIKGEGGESLPAVNGSKMANGQPDNESESRAEEKKEESSGPKKVELKSVS